MFFRAERTEDVSSGVHALVAGLDDRNHSRWRIVGIVPKPNVFFFSALRLGDSHHPAQLVQLEEGSKVNQAVVLKVGKDCDPSWPVVMVLSPRVQATVESVTLVEDLLQSPAHRVPPCRSRSNALDSFNR